MSLATFILGKKVNKPVIKTKAKKATKVKKAKVDNTGHVKWSPNKKLLAKGTPLAADTNFVYGGESVIVNSTPHRLTMKQQEEVATAENKLFNQNPKVDRIRAAHVPEQILLYTKGTKGSRNGGLRISPKTPSISKHR